MVERKAGAVEIKFRGRDVKTGELVYGSFCRPDGIIPDWNPNIEHTVEPGSVAQLVGYDKNGDEVYEGDVVEFDIEDPQDHTKTLHYEYTAHLKGFATAANGCYISSEMFKEKVLKK